MNRLQEKQETLRAFVNKDYTGYLFDKQFADRPDDWNTLCVALDTLGDTCSALAHFETHGMGTALGEKYLRLYGVFQAIVLQQKAIKYLYHLLKGAPMSIPSGSAWQELRKIRNMATGHPLDKSGMPEEGKLRIFVSQSTISDSGFSLLICDEKSADVRLLDIDLKPLYEQYKLEALSFLLAIEQSLIEKWGPLNEIEWYKASLDNARGGRPNHSLACPESCQPLAGESPVVATASGPHSRQPVLSGDRWRRGHVANNHLPILWQ